MTADRQSQADQAATLYRAGHSTTCVANQIGMAWTTTRELLQHAGVTFRTRGTRCIRGLHQDQPPVTKRRYTRLTGTARTEHAAALRARYEAGATIRQLVADTGHAPGTVTGLLRSAGTRMRPAGRPKTTS